jgi:Cu/Ag efflux protein CusF
MPPGRPLLLRIPLYTQMGDSGVMRCFAVCRRLLLASTLVVMCATTDLQAGEWGPYESEGTVVSMVPDQGLLLLEHEPIRAPGFFMGKMEMPFSLAEPTLITGLKVGDRIHFRVSEDKKSRIVELRKLP